MKIHYYSITIENSSESIESVLSRIEKLNLSSREQDLSGTNLTAEYMLANGNYFHTDFTLRRMTGGPGLAKRGQVTRDFKLAVDEGFGEQTAAVWSEKGFVAIQYNHRGPKLVHIIRYLELFFQDDAKLELEPFIEPDVWARFQSSSSHLSMECIINTRTLTEEQAGQNIPLQQALQWHQQTGSGKLHLRLYYGDGRPGGAMNLIDHVRELFARREYVESLKVGVREDEDSPSEVLNLFNHQESGTVSDEKLTQTAARRYTSDSRCNEIQALFEEWLQNL